MCKSTSLCLFFFRYVIIKRFLLHLARLPQMFTRCSSEWQMYILHAGKKHTSPAAMGRRRILPPSKRERRQSTYVLSLSTRLPAVSRGQRDPSKRRSLKKKSCAEQDTEAKKKGHFQQTYSESEVGRRGMLGKWKTSHPHRQPHGDSSQCGMQS